jgi:hypothetical protein
MEGRAAQTMANRLFVEINMQERAAQPGKLSGQHERSTAFVTQRWLATCLLCWAVMPVFAGELGACLGSVSGIRSLVSTGESGCLNAGDTSRYKIGLDLTGSNTNRYDLGIYVNVEAGDAKTDAGANACFHEYLWPNTNVLADVNRTSGYGPFSERDGNPDDLCGDFATLDIYRLLMIPKDDVPDLNNITEDDVEDVPIVCQDSNNDGLLELSTCLAYANVSGSNVCTDFDNPPTPAGGTNDGQGAGYTGTTAKCNCGIGTSTNPPVPIASTTASCLCTRNGPNRNYDCTVSSTNASPANLAAVLPTEDNHVQPGTAAYIRYKINDLKAAGGTDAGGTFTNLAPTNGTASPGGGAEIMLAPEGGRCIAGVTCTTTAPETYVLGPGETTSLNFTYTNTTLNELVNIEFTTWKDVDSLFPNETEVVTNTTTCQVLASATYVVLNNVSSHVDQGNVFINWETATEASTIGFDVYRQDSINPGSWTQVNLDLVQAVQEPGGGHYSLLDASAMPGHSYNYKIVEQEWSGERNEHGPFEINTANAHTPRQLSREYSEPATVSTVAVHSDWNPPVVTAIAKGPDQKLADRSSRAVKTNLGKHEKTGTSQSVQKADKKERIEAADAIKIVVSSDGFYSIGVSEIADRLGYSSRQATRMIGNSQFTMVSNEGAVAWESGPDNQSIHFYGQKRPSRYGDENTYWLSAGEASRIPVAEGLSDVVNPLNQGFNETAHAEKNLLNRPLFVPAPDDDFLYWKILRPGSPTPFDISTPGTTDLGGNARLRALVLRNNAPGQARIFVNTDTAECSGVVNWVGTAEVEITLAQHCLLPENNVYIESQMGALVVDSISIDYAREYVAADGSLQFRGENNPSVTVSGFDSDSIAVYDLSDPQLPVKLIGLEVNDTGGNHVVTLVPQLTTTPYLATNASKTPDRIESYFPAQLRDPGRSAHYLVIGRAEFEDSAAELVELRSAGDAQAMFVSLASIMDEFNDGKFDPAAIRDFLTYAHDNWQLAPEAVALIGRGHFDYLDHQGFGFNLMPPLVELTSNAYVAADNLLGDINGDMIPEIAVGRIPVISPDELGLYIAKLRAHQLAVADDPSNRVHLVADVADPRTGNFPEDSEAIAINLPAGLNLKETFLYQTHTLEETQNRVLDSFNLGSALVNFTGHGGLSTFSGYPHTILSRTDVETMSLVNPGQSPVVTALSCLISSYAWPGSQALGEDLVIKDNGGAIAVIGPLSLSTNHQSVSMSQSLLPRLLDAGSRSIGSAYIEGLREYVESGGNPELVVNYSLLGDPNISLNQ